MVGVRSLRIIRIEPDTEIISTEGNGFINLGYFHFNNDRLYQILLKIDEQKIGYYYLLKNLSEKYGKPSIFTPKKVSWENEKVKIVLEKPCTLKYVDNTIWDEIINRDQTSDAVIEQIRKKFVDDL